MKKMIASCLLVVSCVLAMSFRPVAISFEGSIRYETTTSGEVPKAITDRIAKQYELLYKGADLKIKGGAPLRGEFLIKKSKATMYIIRSDLKNVYEVDLHDKRLPKSTSAPQVKRLKETVTIAGYSCQKYEMLYDQNVKVYVWTTTSIAVDASGLSPLTAAQLQLPESVEGFPLKLQFEAGSFSLTCTATSVEAMTLSAKEFVLPSGMTMKKL